MAIILSSMLVGVAESEITMDESVMYWTPWLLSHVACASGEVAIHGDPNHPSHPITEMTARTAILRSVVFMSVSL